MRDIKEYRSIPFWSWNDKLEKEKLIDQIHWMNDNGIGGYFMHARSGLQTEYLSEEWMQCIEACADEAEKLDMKAWIYDENGWPSGFVGGKLLEEEKNRDRYILVKEGAFDQSATVNYLMADEELVRVSEEQDTTATYLNLYIHTAVSTADILNPDVVKQFLTLTHEAYKKRFGEQFAQKIEGFFTDEPQYHRWHTSYTDMMEMYWKEQYDEDILDGLGLLFVEKKGYRSFRYRYWKAMQTLMLNNFAKQVYEWCDNNGVKLTGHYVEEGTIGYQLMCCGGMMPFYEYEHIPGIDWLGKWTDSVLAAKQVGSVAAQLGKNQVLTETFGCCGWDVKPSDLRRIVGAQYVNGVNMMCHHLLPYSERGTRKYDYPAHYSDVNPWVKEDFKTFNDYFTMIGHLLGEGKQNVNVAVMHPTRSAYFDYKRELLDIGFGVAKLDEQLQEAMNTLSFHGVDYHFLDETLLEKYGFVQDGRIGVAKCTYDYLVFPTMYTMDKSTEKMIRAYVEQGGKVLLLGEKPTYLEAEEYCYDYLESNVSLEEIIQAQPYLVSNYDTKIYSTYRLFDGKDYIYASNSSMYDTYSQVYSFDGKDFAVTLKPGEDVLLCVSEEPKVTTQQLMPYRLRFRNAEVSVQDNYLPVDVVRYSEDGKNYSEPWPVMALFEKLIRDKYCGDIYLQYEFEIDEVPSKICLRAEKSNDIAAWLNGKELTQKLPTTDSNINLYDIAPFVKQGLNTYITQINWYEDEMVHYALFGENVSESLRNCIVYDTELQPIEVIGQFGVYSKVAFKPDEDARYMSGSQFYIGAMPTVIQSEPTTEGFPFLSGELVLKQNVNLDTADTLLQIDGEYMMAYVKVNGKEAGKILFDTEIDISKVAKKGENEIEVRFLLSNRNLMGPHHLEGPKDRSIAPDCFQMFGWWNGNKSDMYHDEYDLKKFDAD